MKCINCLHKAEIKRSLGCGILKIKRNWFAERECVGFVLDSAMLVTSPASTAGGNSVE